MRCIYTVHTGIYEERDDNLWPTPRPPMLDYVYKCTVNYSCKLPPSINASVWELVKPLGMPSMWWATDVLTPPSIGWDVDVPGHTTEVRIIGMKQYKHHLVASCKVLHEQS